MTGEQFVWVIQTHEGHGESADVLGVYVSEQAAREALGKQRNMEAYTDHLGQLRGRPVDEHAYPHTWAAVEKYRLES